MDENSFLDTTPGKNADRVFESVLRQGQRDRTKDLGPPCFRITNRTAERLMDCELSAMNLQPPKGIRKLEQLKV